MDVLASAPWIPPLTDPLPPTSLYYGVGSNLHYIKVSDRDWYVSHLVRPVSGLHLKRRGWGPTTVGHGGICSGASCVVEPARPRGFADRPDSVERQKTPLSGTDVADSVSTTTDVSRFITTHVPTQVAGRPTDSRHRNA